MISASFSDVGPRSRNEDRVLEPFPTSDGSFLTAIADGIGGSDNGALAAELAIASIKLAANEDLTIAGMFSLARDSIVEHANLDFEVLRMGTTLSLCRITEETLEFGHVGDSRIYLLRRSGLQTLTKDQTQLAELVEKGIFSPRQAVKYPRKGVLTSALSNYADYDIVQGQVALETGDRILLVTDGVYNCVPKSKIVEASHASDSVRSLTSNLRELVRDAAPSDNYSAVVIEI